MIYHKSIMFKKVTFMFFIFLAGFIGAYLIYGKIFPSKVEEISKKINLDLPFGNSKDEVIGFLPYWLISKADKDYTKYLTTLAYFSLSLSEDGTVQKFTNPGETEPGYLSLTRGKADSFFESFKKEGATLSLVIFGGDDEKITAMLNEPEISAQNLMSDISPLMDEYGFTDLNLDIEQVGDASPSARLKYTRFVKKVGDILREKEDTTLSVCVYASSFVKETNLVDIINVEPLVDKFIVMAYDYHSIGSSVTGAVAPGEGGGATSEFDVLTSIKAGRNMVPSEKIVLGIPLYGYEWETIRNTPRSATIPGTGMTISNRRAEELLGSCATCSAVFDETDKENYIIYKNDETGNFHQAFFPDIKSTEYKIKLAKDHKLGGLALWALGYEGNSILEPLSAYLD